MQEERWRRLCVMIYWFIALATMALLPSAALAQNVTYYDYCSSPAEYARTVAELNRNSISPTERGKNEEKQALYAVLCRTGGETVCFDGLAPVCVVAGPGGCYTVYFSSQQQAQQAAAQLLLQPGMRYAECDAEIYAAKEEAEREYDFHTWAAPVLEFDDYLPYVKEWSEGSAIVAVIDSGCCPHPLIHSRMLSGGYDYIDGDEEPTNDLSGHGTAVAGIVIDCTPDMPVYVLPIKVLDAQGRGLVSNVVNAVREATWRGANVINLSMESTVMSEALDDAIIDALKAGITVVVAAGNTGTHTSQVCPAHLMDKGMIVVGGAEYDGGSISRSDYSNYGESVDIYAFGTGILCCSRSGGYVSGTGTSYAAPHVSALCALLHTLHPGISPMEIETRIRLAAQKNQTIDIPVLGSMIPADSGMYLVRIRMNLGDRLALPQTARPHTAMEKITLISSDDTIIAADAGVLEAKGVGCCNVQAVCLGLETMTFEVTVLESPAGTVVLPGGITVLEDGAFGDASSLGHVIIPEGLVCMGSHIFDGCTALNTVTLPASVMEIGDNNFSNAILLCKEGSAALSYAVANQLQYAIKAD